MALGGESRHLTSEQIQEFLDQGLSSREEAMVREHLSVCAHCRGEAESWSFLFAELGSLPGLEPGPDFAPGVIQGLAVHRPLGQRVRSWAARARSAQPAGEHIPPEGIQDYLENLLPPLPSSRLEAHLASCDHCRESLEDWKSFMGSFQGLRRFSPEPGFADRVMAQVNVPAPVPARAWSSVPARVLGWARSLLPQTRRGWAVAGGVASAPTISIAALLYLVFSHPLTTLGTLSAYASLKASALFGSVFSGLVGRAMESLAAFRAYSLVEAVLASPLLVGLGGLIFSLLSAGALWVLYRNLASTHSEDGHARARV